MKLNAVADMITDAENMPIFRAFDEPSDTMSDPAGAGGRRINGAPPAGIYKDDL